MAINLEFLESVYFAFDEPVPYSLTKGELKISPITLKQREMFLRAVDILTVDKNSIPDPKIIQMPYLTFVEKVLLKEPINKEKLVILLSMCLGFQNVSFKTYENGKITLCDNLRNIEINAKEFDEIKRIILYQNFPHYDDSYINPDIKKAMQETDEYRSRGIVIPTLERKMAVISAHTGISKKEQIDMTMRSHELLFEEVVGEVRYNTEVIFAAASGHGDKLEQWIYKKHKGKFDDYFVSTKNFSKSMGGDGTVASTEGKVLDAKLNSF